MVIHNSFEPWVFESEENLFQPNKNFTGQVVLIRNTKTCKKKNLEQTHPF